MWSKQELFFLDLLLQLETQMPGEDEQSVEPARGMNVGGRRWWVKDDAAEMLSAGC